MDYLLTTLHNQGLKAQAFPIVLVTHIEHEWLAASPDRLLKVNDDWCLVEVKNWYLTQRQQKLEDLRYLDSNRKLRKTHGHYYQVQTALMVSGMKRCSFVVHGFECSMEVIEFDEGFCREMLEKAKDF